MWRGGGNGRETVSSRLGAAKATIGGGNAPFAGRRQIGVGAWRCARAPAQVPTAGWARHSRSRGQAWYVTGEVTGVRRRALACAQQNRR